MTERICEHCGSDLYHAASAERVEEARRRHEAKNREQALEILRLQLRVGELEDEHRYRSRKVERQRRTIVRLQNKLAERGIVAHDDRTFDEGPIASRFSGMSLPSDEPLLLSYPDPAGTNKMRRRLRKKKKEKDA